MVRRGTWASWAALLATASGSGCYTGLHDATGNEAPTDGNGDAGSGGEDDPADDDDSTPPRAANACDVIGPQGIRRISHVEYAQILADVLPPTVREQALALSSFPPTTIDSDFTTFATANTVNTYESIAIEDNAEVIADLVLEDLDAVGPDLLPCLSPGFADDDIPACIGELVDDLGGKLFRRKLRDAERELITSLFEDVGALDGPRSGLAAVVQYLLQAPALLYVAEPISEPDIEGLTGSVVQLPPEQLATRLALLFTASTPDDALLTAVAEGRLSTRDEVEAQARRLAESAGVMRALERFHYEWMKGFVIEQAERIHPLWSEDRRAALAEELPAFVAWFFDETDGRFETLMTAEGYPKDPRLAPIYDGDAPRRGLLTTAAAMASQAHDDRTSLIERGAFIRDHLLCIPAPPFPGDIDIDGTLGGFGELPTARQRLEPLMTEPACAGCHSTLNPLGFPLEAYDWIGAHRLTENGAPIDTSAEIGLGSLSGTFADAGELITALAATDEARDCYARHWFRYTFGRAEAPDDRCALEKIQAAFAESDGDIRELLVQIAISDAFRSKQVAQ